MNKKNLLINDFIQWDVRTWSKALDYWEKKIDWSQVNNALELGGREGGLSLWLALKNKKVICSDLQDSKKTAEPLHSKYKVLHLIEYEDINAIDIPYKDYFDIIVFKSIMGGVGFNNNYELQEKAFQEIYKSLKPGGKLLFAENLVASPLHKKLRSRFIKWGGAWRYVTISEMEIFLKDFNKYDMKMTGVIGTFGRTESQRNFLSKIDELILNKICPDRWKYICYGIAEK